MTLSDFINAIFKELCNVNSVIIKMDESSSYLQLYFLNFEETKNNMIQDFVKDLVPLGSICDCFFLTKNEFLTKMIYHKICPETILKRNLNKRAILV